ncbi:hypothetical protein NDU88_007548 [Pleurodeles waltl]|uniref:Uncharacterized protein n=1 Tax=Pleurodeles waltl TaxID=8319 RepID=A0AAV7MGD5_PLEWA|nr:hypothetical protein NDU88_007548 [Pleurodeles waltl]
MRTRSLACKPRSDKGEICKVWLTTHKSIRALRTQLLRSSVEQPGRGTWRPVEALTANSHRTRDADERRDLRPLTWKRRAESRSSPAVGSTRERITAAVEGPPCCDEEEVWRRDAGEETRGETGIVQGS